MKLLGRCFPSRSGSRGVCASSLLLGVAFLGLALLASCGPAASAPSTPAMAKKVAVPLPLVPVDELASKPESFPGQINVSGRIIEVSPGGDGFTLGCEDACVRIPVRFKGKAPEAQADVVVRGRVTKNLEGLYVVEADSVERP